MSLGESEGRDESERRDMRAYFDEERAKRRAWLDRLLLKRKGREVFMCGVFVALLAVATLVFWFAAIEIWQLMLVMSVAYAGYWCLLWYRAKDEHVYGPSGARGIKRKQAVDRLWVGVFILSVMIVLPIFKGYGTHSWFSLFLVLLPMMHFIQAYQLWARDVTEKECLQSHRENTGLCGRCGYDVSRSQSDCCSECGWKLPLKDEMFDELYSNQQTNR
ncbi:hypothetical protein JD969_06425 [Planctomycetota bacterium]|nr:hypothetical protein JD969_06425 [Planctomycetota bacterium]